MGAPDVLRQARRLFGCFPIVVTKEGRKMRLVSCASISAVYFGVALAVVPVLSEAVLRGTSPFASLQAVSASEAVAVYGAGPYYARPQGATCCTGASIASTCPTFRGPCAGFVCSLTCDQTQNCQPGIAGSSTVSPAACTAMPQDSSCAPGTFFGCNCSVPVLRGCGNFNDIVFDGCT